VLGRHDTLPVATDRVDLSNGVALRAVAQSAMILGPSSKWQEYVSEAN